MKFQLSSGSVLASIVLASFVTASPLAVRNSKSNTKQMSTSLGSSAGALYFMTNDPNHNFVVSADIHSNGQVALRQAVETGGKGSHGAVAANGPDALFSQGSVKTAQATKLLSAVNAGSNTVSLFSINPNDPAQIHHIGRPVNSGGEFPMSLAFNAQGTQVCALNGGKVNGVACFSADSRKGLTPLANTVRSIGLNQTTPPSGPAGTTSHVIFSEDGKHLIASVKGVPPTPGFLAVWDVAADGSLSEDFQKVVPGKGGLLPFSMTVIPGKNAVLATDAGVGFDIFDFNSQPKSAGNSSVVPITGQGATCWSSFSKQTGNFYLTDVLTSEVTEVNVADNLKGSIVKQYPQGSGSGTIDNEIASVNGKDFMYALAANATTIDVLSLNAPGEAAGIQKLQMASLARNSGLALDPNQVQGMTAFIKA
jgi:6-phosphogluconolactonase (cycloisomerase 2 family)